MPAKPIAIASHAVAFLVGANAFAASAPAEPDSVRRDSLRHYLLPPVVVTASRLPAQMRDVGFAVSVLSRQNLVAEPTPYATRALELVPGAAIEEAAGPGGPTVLRLRGGSEPFTQVLFDGVPINISGGFLDLQGLTLTNVERVEVARGPLSALWGSAAMSGAVQFITRQGRVGPPAFEVLAEGGRGTERSGQARTELTMIGGAERLRYSSGLAFTYHRGIYELPNDLMTGDASLRLDATPSDRWSFTATARHMDIDAQLPVRDPGVTRAPLDPNQSDARTRTLGAVSATWRATPVWQHRLSLRVLRDDFVYRDQRDGVTDSTSYPFFVFDANFGYHSDLVRTGVEYVGIRELRPRRGPLHLSYGAEWQREDQAVDQSGDFGASRTQLDRSNGAAFAEGQGRLGSRLALVAGARVEKYRGMRAEFLPRGSLVFDLSPERLALRAAAGRAFKAPNLDQQFLENPFTAPNPDLAPETSVCWEVGVFATGRSLAFGVGYFHQRFDDLIRFVPSDDPSKQTNKNLGRARSAGLEVELERHWSERWRSGANLAWIRTKVVDNAGLSPTDYPLGSALVGVPRVTGTAFVAADVLPNTSLLLRATLVGHRDVFSERFTGQRHTLGRHALLGLVAQWHATTLWDVYTRIENLLDRRYFTAFDRPGSPLVAVVGLRWTP